jgi:hypothetical protein
VFFVWATSNDEAEDGTTFLVAWGLDRTARIRCGFSSSWCSCGDCSVRIDCAIAKNVCVPRLMCWNALKLQPQREMEGLLQPESGIFGPTTN